MNERCGKKYMGGIMYILFLYWMNERYGKKHIRRIVYIETMVNF